MLHSTSQRVAHRTLGENVPVPVDAKLNTAVLWIVREAWVVFAFVKTTKSVGVRPNQSLTSQSSVSLDRLENQDLLESRGKF